MAYLLRQIDAYAIAATPVTRSARRDDIEQALTDPRTLLAMLEHLTQRHPEHATIGAALLIVRCALARHQA